MVPADSSNFWKIECPFQREQPARGRVVVDLYALPAGHGLDSNEGLGLNSLTTPVFR